MKTKSRLLKSFVAFICVLIIATFSSLTLVEHSHDCLNSNCVVCDSISATKNLLVTTNAISINNALKLDFSFICVIAVILFNNTDTLVNLKVKLSL